MDVSQCASRGWVGIREVRENRTVKSNYIWTQVALVLCCLWFLSELLYKDTCWDDGQLSSDDKVGPSHTRQPLVRKHLLNLPVYEYPSSEKLHWVHGWVTSHTLWTACALFKRIHWCLFESGLPWRQHSTPIWLYVRREPHTQGALSNGSYKKVTKPQD